MIFNLGYKPRLLLQEFGPPWNSQACHLCGLMHLVLVDKKHQIIAISLWHDSKFCIQTILETPWKSEARCIARIHLILPTTYVPWPAYISLGQFFDYSQKIVEIWHCVFHKKNHDNFLESLCGNLLRIIIFKLLMLLGLRWWNVFFVKYFNNPSLVHGWRWVI
jgi:hypothetical protein